MMMTNSNSSRDPRTDPREGDSLQIGPHKYVVVLVADEFVSYEIMQKTKWKPVPMRLSIGSWGKYMAFAKTIETADQRTK